MGVVNEIAGREVVVAMSRAFARHFNGDIAQILPLVDLSQDSGLLFKWSDGSWHSEPPGAGQGRAVFEGGWDKWNSRIPCYEPSNGLKLMLTRREHQALRCASLCRLRG